MPLKPAKPTTTNAHQYAAVGAKLLTREQERALIHSWQEYEDIEARNAVIDAYQPLATSIARRLCGKDPQKFDEIKQAVNTAFLIALGKDKNGEPRFNLEVGVRFSTYAWFHISNEIRKMRDRSGPIIRSKASAQQRKLLSTFNKVLKRVQDKGQPNLTDANRKEIAEIAGVTMQAVMQFELRQHHEALISTPLRTDDGTSGTLEDKLASDMPTSEEIVIANNLYQTRHAQLNRALDTLTARERYIVEAHLLSEEPKTLSMLGQEFGLSTERVRQIEVGAFEKLKEAMTGEKPVPKKNPSLKKAPALSVT